MTKFHTDNQSTNSNDLTQAGAADLSAHNADLASYHILRAKRLWDEQIKHLIEDKGHPALPEFIESLHVAAFKAKGHFNNPK